MKNKELIQKAITNVKFIVKIVNIDSNGLSILV